MTLHLLNYNNYYNRIIKKYDKLNDYIPHRLAVLEHINFNPNDGISTEQIVNYTGDMPNYLIVSDDGEIVSRWFVIESVRTRAQQFKMTLYRDTIADFESYILEAPVFIEKATVPVKEGFEPFICNDENFSVNQIKTEETLLKDKSGTPWIVGYIAKGADVSSEPNNVIQYDEVKYQVQLNPDFEFNDLSTEDVWKYRYEPAGTVPGHKNTKLVAPNDVRVEVRYVDSSTTSGRNEFSVACLYPFDVEFDTTRLAGGSANGYTIIPQIPNSTIEIQLMGQWESTGRYVVDNLKNYSNDSYVYDADRAYDVLKYNGRTLYDRATGKYYSAKVTATELGANAARLNVFIKQQDNMFQALKEGIAKAQAYPLRSFFTGQPDLNTFSISTKGTLMRIELTQIYQSTGKVMIPKNNISRLNCWDAPYDIICAPFDDCTVAHIKDDFQAGNLSLAAFNALAEAWSGGDSPKLYDLQLLPYCPLPADWIKGDHWINSGAGAPCGFIQDTTGTNVGRIFFAPKSEFSVDINYIRELPSDALERKVLNQCTLHRLCSPNFSGMFDFNIVKNGGIYNFNADCNYKPYNPYIHVNPIFGNLYGQDWNDARGLICGGDFSLPVKSDAWATYELQNKNYQKTFDRRVQHMEVQHKYQRIQDVANIATGTLSGIAGGGMVGSMLGAGPAGAIVGGAMSLGTGIADYNINEALRTEALDYTKDQFAMQLDNIKALPDSLAKVGSYTANNKIFPLLEYYECTEPEKEAFRNKLKYNGMTVGIIDKIKNFQQPEPSYIKGKLIRLETLADDFHVVDTIANELNKGVFI